MIEKGIEENSASLITTTTSRIEVLLTSTQKIPQNVAYFLENMDYDESELFKVLYAVVKQNPEIYGASIAFRTYAFDRNEKILRSLFL